MDLVFQLEWIVGVVLLCHGLFVTYYTISILKLWTQSTKNKLNTKAVYKSITHVLFVIRLFLCEVYLALSQAEVPKQSQRGLIDLEWHFLCCTFTLLGVDRHLLVFSLAAHKGILSGRRHHVGYRVIGEAFVQFQEAGTLQRDVIPALVSCEADIASVWVGSPE